MARREDEGQSRFVEMLNDPASPEETHQALANPRRPYRRQTSTSWSNPSRAYEIIPADDHAFPHHDTRGTTAGAQGLGLGHVSEVGERIQVVLDTSHDRDATRTLPASITPKPSDGTFSQTTTANNTPANPNENNKDSPHVRWATPQSSQYSLKDAAYQHVPSETNLLSHTPRGDGGCPTHGDLLKSRWTWFTTTIVALAVYSTFFSGVFLGIAFVKPRWGQRIGTHGNVTLSTASLLSALFSKTVELSFATVYVATLGQILSRKALTKDVYSRAKGGISIAQMNLRLWIMQPGTLITNWIGVRYAATTSLGVITLVAALAAVFYTTAAEALVAPKLKLGGYEHRMMGGLVAASYANSVHLQQNCRTPILKSTDPDYAGLTCLQIEHAGQGFHNFDSWMSTWATRIATGNTPPEQGLMINRPPPSAILYDNTTVLGQWITPSGENITTDSNKHGRLFQNVTMVMPHIGVINAAKDPVNRVLQPDDLRGQGEYFIKASVPAPALSVLCVGLAKEELQPMLSMNGSAPIWPFRTVLDEYFGWTVDGPDYAPVFPRAPAAYNTVVNFTLNWGPSAVYLLATPPPTIKTSDYMICSLRSMQYPNCTTAYHEAVAGAELSVYCDHDPLNDYSYAKLDDKARYGTIETNWKDVGVEWIKAVSLSQGVDNNNASIARILTQMIPNYSNVTATVLNAALPSLGEAVSVLAGDTLLLSTEGAPFIPYWNYSTEYTILQQPQYQYFNALLSYKDYASGGTQPWQGIFYIILIAVFALNCFCLGYLCWNFCHYGQLTDYTEPQNLFALAINSPPSNMLAGACGGGPSGDMLRRKWLVDMSRASAPSPHMGSHGTSTGVSTGQSHPHFYVRCPDDDYNTYDGPDMNYPSHNSTPSIADQFRFPSVQPESRVSRFRNRFSSSPHRAPPARSRTVDELNIDESPAVEQYMKLIGKKGRNVI